MGTLLRWLGSATLPRFRRRSIEWRERRNLALNLKFFGYELAREIARSIPPRSHLQPRRGRLLSKPSTQTDIESDWAAYWFQELKIPLTFHRKLWELAYVLQTLYETGVLRTDARGLGFGCGAEPIASYLASRGVNVLATDLPPQRRQAKGWLKTGQHATSVQAMFHAHLVTRAIFDDRVKHRFVDMNAIPADLENFDFCWSICAMEHLGSIEKGMKFVVSAMHTLRPGGVAVHTTEFNFLEDRKIMDKWPTVLFQRTHFEELAERLQADGHKVATLDFDVGTKPLDRFIDMPPYPHNCPAHLRPWMDEAAHIKVSIDGFVSTCFGLIVWKKTT
ncbi:MAG TPA: methyltransferase domain-containing protein [Methylocella sp.]|nr:methyltransferase domain-containing protein [Methylocella sp.]